MNSNTHNPIFHADKMPERPSKKNNKKIFMVVQKLQFFHW